MLVWTSVATDNRVLREASALVATGHRVHIVGRAVPPGFVPPAGVTVQSVGSPPLSAGRSRRLSLPERGVRWLLLPTHVRRRLAAWQTAARRLAQAEVADGRVPDVVHAHDFTALPVGASLAEQWKVPLVYDSHEYWAGRPVEGRPAPLLRKAQRRTEARLGARARAVITVGDGVARALAQDHPDWPPVTVVRNSFPLRSDLPPALDAPTGLVYAGRLAAFRELEVVAAASRGVDLPITVMGPADGEWLSGFDPGAASVLPSAGLDVVDARILAAGGALVTHSDRWRNHRLALPNKLFHAVSLGVPVVATDVGELAAVVRRHGLGELYPPGDSVGLVAAIDRFRARYADHVRAVGRARFAMSWEQDSAALVHLYGSLT